MPPREKDPVETVNREQQDDAQVLDASDMEDRDGTNIESGESERGGSSDPAEVVPDDRPDLIETMDAMQRSGRIDNDAYAGERVDDEMLGVSLDDDPGTTRG